MLDLILSYIFTILVSYGIDFITVKKVIDVIFGNGCKIDFTTDSSLHKELSKSTKLLRLIPLINILDSLIMYTNIRNSQDYIIDNLSVSGLLEDMTYEEKEKYNNTQSFFTAMKILVDSKKNSKDLSVTRLNDGSLVYSKYVDDEICIDTTGTISKLKNEEQIKIILEEIQNTDSNSPLKDMFIEEEIIPKKSKLILKLEKLRDELKKHIDELENEEQKDKQKIKKL